MEKLDKKRLWTLVGILFIGVAIRIVVVINTEETAASSYSSLVKVSLNYEWARTDMKKETQGWKEGTFFFENLYELDSSGIDFRELNRQLEMSNHPPLYYAFLHVLVAKTQWSPPSIRKGLFMNVVISFITFLVFFKLCQSVFKDSEVAIFGVAILAFGLAPLQVVTLQKGYELMTLFTIAQVYFVFHQMEKQSLKWHHYFWFFGVSLGSFLTHYYAYPITAVLCGIIGFHYIVISRNLSRVVGYAGTVIMAIASAILIYSNTLNDVLYDQRSRQIQENMSAFDLWDKLETMLSNLAVIYSGPILILFFVVLLVSIRRYRSKKVEKKKWIFFNHKVLYVLVFGFLTFFLIKLVSPSNSIRYLAPVIPLLLFVVILIFEKIQRRRQLLMTVFAIILLGYTSSNIFRAINKPEKSRKVIQQWQTELNMNTIAQDEPVLLLADKVGEPLRPILFHTVSREVAISLNELDKKLLNQRPNAVVLLSPKFSDDVRLRLENELESLGYYTNNSVRKFAVYRRIGE